MDELDTTRSRCRSKEENSDNVLSACAFFMNKLGRRGMHMQLVKCPGVSIIHANNIIRLIALCKRSTSKLKTIYRREDRCSPLGEEPAMISFSSFGPALVTSGKPNYRLGMGRKLTVVSAISLSLLLLLALVFGRCGRYGYVQTILPGFFYEV